MYPLEEQVRRIAKGIPNTHIVVEEDEICIIHTGCGMKTDNSRESCITRAFVGAGFSVVFSHINVACGATVLHLVYRVKPPGKPNDWP